MSNAKWMVTIWMAAVMGVILFYCQEPVQAADPIKLNYSIFFPAPHKNTVLATEWAQEIEKRTNGAVKITMFPGGTLTPADKCYDGVVNGLSDIGMSVMGYTCGLFPLPEVIRPAAGVQERPVGHKAHQPLLRKIQAQGTGRREGPVSTCPWPGHPAHQKAGQEPRRSERHEDCLPWLERQGGMRPGGNAGGHADARAV